MYRLGTDAFSRISIPQTPKFCDWRRPRLTTPSFVSRPHRHNFPITRNDYTHSSPSCTMARKAAITSTKSCCRKTRDQSKHAQRAPCKEMNQRAATEEAMLVASSSSCSKPQKPTIVRSTSSSCSGPSALSQRGKYGNKKRRVRFSTKVKVESRYASEEDLKNAWLSGSDYVLFEKDCGRTIAAIRRACSLRQDGSPQYRLNAEEFTASGLEDMLTDELKRHRGFLKGRHHHHVLMEQHMQRVHGVVDAEQLQAISQLFSTESCHIALGRGTVKSY
jgi:hypothetical protein